MSPWKKIWSACFHGKAPDTTESTKTRQQVGVARQPFRHFKQQKSIMLRIREWNFQVIPSYSHFELVYWITFTYCFTASSSLLHFEPHHLCAILRYPSRLLLSAPYWRCEAPHLAPFQWFHRFQRETGTPPGYSRANPQRWRGHHSAQPHPHLSANQTSKLSRLSIQGDYKAKRSLAIRFSSILRGGHATSVLWG